jgi:hypothetical protein
MKPACAMLAALGRIGNVFFWARAIPHATVPGIKAY